MIRSPHNLVVNTVACLMLVVAAGCGTDTDGSPVASDVSGDAIDDVSDDTTGSEEVAADDASDDTRLSVDTTEPPAFLTPPASPSDALFASDRVIDVAITVAAEDWDTLRQQTRTLVDVIGPGCLDGPVDSPFTWFSAEVSVDGQIRSNVGLRKKGFIGSLSTTRPSLKIKFDEYVDDAELLGLDRLTLNNGRQDPSRMNTCLAYDIYRAAGMPAPRCNFAHVTVNGQSLGLYANVETVKKRFLRRHFPEPLGPLWEGQLSDFTDGWLATFDRKIGSEGAEDVLFRLQSALEASDADLLGALEAVIDVDHFLSFWAAEVLIAHWDGYNGNRNNFYVYHDTSRDKLVFMPWGADATFEDRGGPASPNSVVANSALAYRLYSHPVGRALYLEALQALMAGVWDEDALIAKVDQWDVLTAGVRLPGTFDAAAESLQRIREFISAQRPTIDSELAGLPVEWPATPGERPCFDDEGSIEGTVTTTWATIFEENLFLTGDAELTFDPTDPNNPPLRWGAKAGVLPEEPTNGRIQFAAQLTAGGFLFFDMTIPLASIVTGTTVMLDSGESGGGVVFYVSPQQDGRLFGVVTDGTVTFEQAGTNAGDPIVMSIESPVYGAWE